MTYTRDNIVKMTLKSHLANESLTLIATVLLTIVLVPWVVFAMGYIFSGERAPGLDEIYFGFVRGLCGLCYRRDLWGNIVHGNTWIERHFITVRMWIIALLPYAVCQLIRSVLWAVRRRRKARRA